MKVIKSSHFYLSAMLLLTLVSYASAFTVSVKDRSEATAMYLKPAVIFTVPATASREVDIATLDMNGRN